MSELPKKGELIAGKYMIEGILGQGGMGAVFEVNHRLTGKRFAVKWLLPSLSDQDDAVSRFLREAQVAGRVDHPNVVEVYDVGQQAGSFYMVMELLQGESLARRLERVSRMSVPDASRILIPIMHGLSAAHAAGVIHRDLKPDNIFLCRTALSTEIPKLLDFGISKMTAQPGEINSNVTRFGLLIGTPHYMSPEQLKGEPVDHRADVYALGVILYELIGGSVPFPGANIADLLLMVSTEEPPPLNELAPATPPALVQLVARAMSRERAARFQTVEEFGRALSGLSGGIGFAADTGDPARASGAHMLTPSVRTMTPLATEIRRPATPAPDSLPTGKPKLPLPVPIIAGLASAIAALALAAYTLLSPPESDHPRRPLPIITAAPSEILPPPATPSPPRQVLTPEVHEPWANTQQGMAPVVPSVPSPQQPEVTNPSPEPISLSGRPTGNDPSGMPESKRGKYGRRANRELSETRRERPHRRDRTRTQSTEESDDVQQRFRIPDRTQGMSPDEF